MNFVEKQLIISFHDLHPNTLECCRRFIENCQKLGADQITLLAVPEYHRQRIFTEHKELIDYLCTLPKENYDLCLHGYYHKADEIEGGWIQKLKGKLYTQGEGEFYQLTYQEATERLKGGMTVMKKLNLPIYGFTAPAWLVSPEAKRAIVDCGFSYNTLWDKVELPQANISVMAPALVYSSRNAWRRFLSKIWVPLFYAYVKNCHVLRIAVHPIDFEYPAIEKQIYQLIEKALQTRTPSTYRDLIPPESRIPVPFATS